MTASHSADLRGRDASSLGLSGLVVVAVGVAAIANPDTIEDGPVICPFRLITGLPCPGCGLTRSWVYLVHGQWYDALAANPFGVIAFGLAMALVVATVLAVWRRRPLPDVGSLIRSRPFIVLGLGWALFGLFRLVSAAAFSP